MTEYWVSQGNKWCDLCKIYISNNPSSIRNHDLGQRHKDNVAKRLTTMRKDKADKEKQEKEAARAVEQIEAKAKRSYEKDIATVQKAKESNTPGFPDEDENEWQLETSSGYYYNTRNGLHYDPNSGFYYSDTIGKWVTREEAYVSTHLPSDSKNKKPLEKKITSKLGMAHAPGPVVAASLNPMRSVKGAAPSSFAVSKRKRIEEKQKPKTVSEEEKAALKAREAAKKRVEKREKPLFGLYKH